MENLKTERLILKPLTKPDVNFIFKHFADTDVCKYLDQEPFKDIKEAEDIVKCYANPEKDPHGRWAIFKTDEDSIIGTCGYHKLDIKNMMVEIGYDLAKGYWGKGYMSEALTELLNYCFKELKVNRVGALTNLKNEKSISILSKFGFKKEGILREYVYCNGKFDDQLSLSLLKSEWLK